MSEVDFVEVGEFVVWMCYKNYVFFVVVLKDYEKFDVEFFGFSFKEVVIMDL